MLPLPHGAKISSESDKSILHTLESAVIDWTHQIKDVIKSNSSAPLDEGLSPGPMVEIDFWAAKAANLKSIHEQLADEKIQKISKVLQARVLTILHSILFLMKLCSVSIFFFLFKIH
jgi:dynein heavy chain, axonemal